MVFTILKRTFAAIFPPSKVTSNATAVQNATTALSVLDAPDEEGLPVIPPSGPAIIASIGILAGPRYTFRRNPLPHFPNIFLGLWCASASQLLTRSIPPAPRVAYCTSPHVTDSSSPSGGRHTTCSATPSPHSSESSNSLLSLLETPDKDVVS
jgi:hypothetical protein